MVWEQQSAYAAAGAGQDHALVRELWAVEGQSDRSHVQRIAERSGLPVKWLSALPRINGEQGMDKLMEEERSFPESPLLKVNGSLIAEAGKLRYPRECRIEMFRAIAGGIRRCNRKVQIALCKEMPQVWKAVGLEEEGLYCNCTG